MDDKKICFIICSNQKAYEDECRYYLSQLVVPAGYQVYLNVIRDAKSMTEGYDRAMKQSDAKYKVYLHQDVFIVNRNFILDFLKIFENADVGMIGVAGTKKLPKSRMMFSDKMVGKIYTCNIFSSGEAVFEQPEGNYESVQAIDGLLMITQYDLPWRKDLFLGWDFYDASQSMEFLKKGYQIAVPRMEQSWCMHDDETMNLENYFHWQKVFDSEYGAYLDGRM